MSVEIKTGYGRDGFGDRAPMIDEVLRSIATDLSALNEVNTALAALTSSAPAALTSSQNATTVASDLPTAEALANALQTSYNALQVDVAALRTKLTAAITDIAAIRTALVAGATIGTTAP